MGDGRDRVTGGEEDQAGDRCRAEGALACVTKPRVRLFGEGEGEGEDEGEGEGAGAGVGSDWYSPLVQTHSYSPDDPPRPNIR